MKILCIGATNRDIIGVSTKKLISADSNPGRVQLELGGVAKNIAEDLYRIGENVEFITFIGNDAFGEEAILYFNDLGINYEHSIISKDLPSGVYMAIHGANGELIAAINDFSLIESVEIDFFESLEDYINAFDTLVLDTNLSQKTLVYLIEKYQGKMIVCDGVSQSKVIRLKPVLSHIDLLKINRLELRALLNMDEDDVIIEVNKLLQSGIGRVVVTNGKEAITYNTEGTIYQTSIIKPAKIKSSAGAGDALLSGIIAGLSRGKSMHESVKMGKKAASFTMEVDQACHPELSITLIEI